MVAVESDNNLHARAVSPMNMMVLSDSGCPKGDVEVEGVFDLLDPDLAGADASSLDQLPEAAVTTRKTGDTTITFSDVIVIRGVISSSKGRSRAGWADADRLVITSLDVHGSDEA